MFDFIDLEIMNDLLPIEIDDNVSVDDDIKSIISANDNINEEVKIHSYPCKELIMNGQLFYQRDFKYQKDLAQGPQEKTLDVMKQDNKKIMIKHGNYQFTCFENEDKFIKFLLGYPENKRCFFEVLLDNKPQYMFCDIDGNYKDLPKISLEDIINNLIVILEQAFKDFDFEPFDQDNLRILSSSTKDKISIHINYLGKTFKNCNEQLVFWTYVTRIIIEKYDSMCYLYKQNNRSNEEIYEPRTLVDLAVYTKNRAMRTIYSGKQDDDLENDVLRILQPYRLSQRTKLLTPLKTVQVNEYLIYQPDSIDHYDITLIPKFKHKKNINKRSDIEKIIYANIPNVEISSFANRLFKLNNRGKRICIISGEENLTDNSFVIWKNDGLYHGCHDSNCKGILKPIYEFETKFIKPIEEEIIRTANICPFDAKDPYCWIDFDRDYSTTVFKSLDSLKRKLKKDLPRVLAFITEGGSLYVKKDDCSEKLTSYVKSNNMKFLWFNIKYYDMEKTEKPVDKRTKEYKNSDKEPVFIKKEVVKSISLGSEDLKSLIPRYGSLTIDPDNLDTNKFNLWRGLQAQKVNSVDMEKVQPFLDFCENIFQNKLETNYFLSYLRSMCVDPGSKLRTGLFFYSKSHGVGKNFIQNLFYKFILGEAIVTEISGLGELVANFNSYLTGKKLIIVNETSSTRDSFMSNFDRLKDLITNNRNLSTRKGIDGCMIKNFFSIFINSNHMDSIYFEEDDRRLSCLSIKDTFRQNTEYFATLSETLENQDSANHIYTYLLNMEEFVEVNNPLKTQLKEEQIEISKPSYVRFLDHLKELEVTNEKNRLEQEKKLANEKKSTTQDENTIPDKFDGWYSYSQLYKDYVAYCSDNGEKNCMSGQKFSTNISNYMDKEKKSGAMRYKFKSIDLEKQQSDNKDIANKLIEKMKKNKKVKK